MKRYAFWNHQPHKQGTMDPLGIGSQATKFHEPSRRCQPTNPERPLRADGVPSRQGHHELLAIRLRPECILWSGLGFLNPKLSGLIFGRLSVFGSKEPCKSGAASQHLSLLSNLEAGFRLLVWHSLPGQAPRLGHSTTPVLG